jgi:pyroglutamyl-peptidase
VSSLSEEINGYTLTKLRLPVVFGEAAKAVLDVEKEISPDVIICVGQAGGRSDITPELVGINLRHAAIPDNKGNKPSDEKIIENGNDAYFSTLSVRKIVEAINASGVPSQVSYSAGAYVCNDVLYTLLAQYNGSDVKIGFIHVPYSSEQGKSPSMPMEDIVKGLTVAIENI